MKNLPNWAKAGRGQWEYYGQKRPKFAIEPKPGEESVWDYPRPPRLETDSREIVVRWGETILAETTRAVRILETASPPTFYLPPDDIRSETLRKASGSSRCEWKGTAIYWDVVIQDHVFPNAGWSYPEPFSEYKNIAGYLSFYPSKLDCFINGEKVRPQPGGFYGGWITDEIVGPVKGESKETYL